MLLNKGSTDLTVEMGQATFPVIHMEIGHEMVNALFGYENEMEGSYLRAPSLYVQSSNISWYKVCLLSLIKWGQG